MIKIIKREKQVDNKIIERLAKDNNTTKEIVQLLLNRGYGQDYIGQYIQGNEFYIAPFNSITNIDETVERLVSYLEDDKAEIYVFADYDADGVNAGYIMTDVLNAIKESIGSSCSISVYYPNRCEGYGLSMSFCKAIAPRKTNKRKLVITVDNGITKKEEVAYLQSKGVECIITDHHAPKAGETPNCLIVDPWLNDLTDINAKGLCGAAVAYKVCGRLLEAYGDESNFIMNYLPNAAIATITDIMPATPENIGMVGHGLWLIDNGYANESIQYFKQYINKSKITPTDIGFTLGPQINACGRMGDIHKATDFMFGNGDIQEMYNEMVRLNDERKSLEKNIMNEISKMNFDNDLMVIIHVPNLGGLGGTVASKVVEMFGKPCILLSGDGDILHGSARSYGGLDLHALFSMAVKNNVLTDFGGHNVAAGVTVEKNNIENLRDFLNSTIAKFFVATINEEEVKEDTIIEVDDIISLADIKKQTIQPYESLLCFGDLKEPIFAIKDVDVLEARTSSNNPNHLCLNVQDNTCIGTKNRYGKIVGKEIWVWNKMPEYIRLGEPKKVHLLGKLIPDFRNPKFYVLDVQSIIPA